MQIEQLNFHHLFYFWRVARIGHLTRAAQELHIAQSALSSQIKQLDVVNTLKNAVEGKRNAADIVANTAAMQAADWGGAAAAPAAARRLPAPQERAAKPAGSRTAAPVCGFS